MALTEDNGVEWPAREVQGVWLAASVSIKVFKYFFMTLKVNNWMSNSLGYKKKQHSSLSI